MAKKNQVMYPNLKAATDFLIDKNIDIPTDILIGLNTIGALKTYDYYLGKLESLVKTLYSGAIGGEFVSIMDNLILGQLSNAYETAWIDSGFELPPDNYIRDASQAMVADQQAFVQDFYRAIVDAKIDQTPIEPLLSRAGLWANQWNTAYNDGIRLVSVELGGKLMWREGDTIEKCDTCVRLDGIVMFAKEWDELGVHPQGGPNPLLECLGFRCGCSLEPTDKRRSPRAFDTVMNIVNK